MSKVRINDLAREMEVKSRQILDVLGELGLAGGKTHSSSLEDFEAEKVRAHLRASRSGGHSGAAASRAPQGFQPKVDLSHISKPGDALKAILAKKQEEEAEARHPHVAARTAPPAAAVPARPAPPAAAVVASPPLRRLVPSRAKLCLSRVLRRRLWLRHRLRLPLPRARPPAP